jgi:hypothetical protein
VERDSDLQEIFKPILIPNKKTQKKEGDHDKKTKMKKVKKLKRRSIVCNKN